MTRSMVVAAVILAAYCLLDIVMSAVTAIVWRTRAVAPMNLPPSSRARRLFILRMTPSLLALGITLVIVLPAFTSYEPFLASESVGPVLQVLASLGGAQLLLSIAGALTSAWRTARLNRAWAAAATTILDRADHSVTVIDSASPLVALVGVARPQLIAAKAVIDACTESEINTIVRHENGHLIARDNLKRWILSSMPDFLGWTSVHKAIVSEWHHAAEDAADDAAAGDDAAARAELAGLLLKVVRLAPQGAWRNAVVSPFVEDDDGLERRIRRLLSAEREAPAPFAILPTLVMVMLTGTALATIASPRALEVIFDVFEALVAFGR